MCVPLGTLQVLELSSSTSPIKSPSKYISALTLSSFLTSSEESPDISVSSYSHDVIKKENENGKIISIKRSFLNSFIKF